MTAKGDNVITADGVCYCAENANVSLTSGKPLEIGGEKLSENTDGTYLYTITAEDAEIDISAVDDSGKTDKDDTRADDSIKYNKAETSATVATL